MTTGGAVMNADNLTVTTEGNSSAPIRTDRGGGTVTVNGGNYTSNGTGSPAIYSTAAVTVNDANLISNASEALVIEGANSIALNDTTVSGTMAENSASQSTNIHNVLIYQSMSGDADVGTSSFSMTGGSLTANAGDMFYVTNTTATINLNSATLTLATDYLLKAVADNWGTTGSNGGNVTLTAEKQVLTGKILVDDVSSLTLNLESGTSFSGSINNDYASDTSEAGTVAVTLNDDATWTLTGDSYISSFTGDTANINAGSYKVYVNGTELDLGND